jgi:hypothetical protein
MISAWEIALIVLIFLVVVLPLFVRTSRDARCYTIAIYALIGLLVILVVSLTRLVLRLYIALFGMMVLVAIVVFAMIYGERRQR